MKNAIALQIPCSSCTQSKQITSQSKANQRIEYRTPGTEVSEWLARPHALAFVNQQSVTAKAQTHNANARNKLIKKTNIYTPINGERC